VDRPYFVLTTRETPSTRAVASPPRQCFATNPHQNAAQSRIGGIDRQACDQIEIYCRRVLPDPNRPGVRQAVSMHVPMGQSLQQGTQRDRAAPETLTEGTSHRDPQGPVHFDLVIGKSQALAFLLTSVSQSSACRKPSRTRVGNAFGPQKPEFIHVTM